MSSHLRPVILTRIIRAVLLLSIVAACSGCAIVGDLMNPFESEFSCKANTGGGSCGSVSKTYKTSVTGEPLPDASVSTTPPAAQDGIPTISMSDQANLNYRTASLNKMAKLLKDPVTPVVAPPVVIRILILPYQDDDNGLNLMRYSYLMVDKPKWVLGDYLESANAP